MSIGNRFNRLFKMGLRGNLKAQYWYWAPIETMVLTVSAVCTGLFLSPDDPLFIQQGFPWLMIFSLLIALRYGSIYGVLSVVIIALTFKQQTAHTSAWFSYLSGSIVAITCAGEFCQSWFTRERRALEMLNYANLRLDYLSRAFYLAKLSQNQLEQNLISKPITLQQIVEAIRQITISKKGKMDPESLGGLLSLLSQYCGLISATIYKADANQQISDKKLAGIGEETPLDINDPMLFKLNENRTLRYQAINDLAEEYRSNYLAVALIQSSDAKIFAYLTITDMVFSNLNDETLQILSVLLGCYANDLTSYNQASPILEYYPDCPSFFALELQHMSDLKASMNIESTLVGFFVPKEKHTDYLKLKLTETHRSLDYIWAHKTPGYVVYFNLIPFSNAVILNGYLNRITRFFKTEFNITPEQEGVLYQHRTLNASPPVFLIKDMLNAINE